jgi:hypothetical protein
MVRHGSGRELNVDPFEVELRKASPDLAASKSWGSEVGVIGLGLAPRA